MDSLPPIPAPRRHFLRELRIQLLPLVVFVGVVALIVYIWRNFVQPFSVVGEVEAVRANVISLQDGTLADLAVDRFERVSRDQPLGRVVTTDPAITEASLNVIAADLKLMQARMGLDKVRNLDAYTRLRLELINEQVALDLARIKLKQADAELARFKKLYDQQLVPQGMGLGTGQGTVFGVDVLQRDHDALESEVTHRTKEIAQLTRDIQTMEELGASGVPPKDPAVEEAIRTQQEKLALLEKPVVLKAPIDGTVSTIYKRPGEKLVRGDPVITIAPLTAERILGYVRQPFSQVLTTNDIVEVRTRASRRLVANARILRIGTELEPINPLLLSPDGRRQEVGLPFLLALPPAMTNLAPGEFVDLAIQYSGK